VNYDIYFVGVGGQGVLTIGEILAEAAMRKGIPASFYPTKGMAQRGGAVKARLRLGRQVVGPNIPESGADLVVSMELSEALKAVRFVKPGGEFLLFGYVWPPTAVMLGKAGYPTLEQVLEQVRAASGQVRHLAGDSVPLDEGVPLPANVFVLGAAIAHTRLSRMLQHDDVAQAIRLRWAKGVDRNLAALQAGMDVSVGSGPPATSASRESVG
jgi:indolepyruvate ferredoxin oxidoreductase beta subunit